MTQNQFERVYTLKLQQDEIMPNNERIRKGKKNKKQPPPQKIGKTMGDLGKNGCI